MPKWVVKTLGTLDCKRDKEREPVQGWKNRENGGDYEFHSLGPDTTRFHYGILLYFERKHGENRNKVGERAMVL